MEGEKEERMPLFVNQSAVSERENFKNPQREEEDRRGGEQGRRWRVQHERRAPPTPSANRGASPVGGSWGSTNSLELPKGKESTRRI